MSNKRLLKIVNNEIYLTPEEFVSVENINLFKGDIRFRSEKTIYLEVELNSFDNARKVLFVKITDYDPKNVASFTQQKVTAKVNYLHFEPVEWKYFEGLLYMYTKGKLLKEKLIIDSPESTLIIPNFTYRKGKGLHQGTNIPFSIPEAMPRNQTIHEDFRIAYKDAVFGLGFLSFNCKSKSLSRTVHLKIENGNLLPEFESIKSYFPKVLGGDKKFNVKATFNLTDHVITSFSATSPEIEKIDAEVISSIKELRIVNLTSNPIVSQPNKTLFTSDDILDNFEPKVIDGTKIILSEEDILNVLTAGRNIRNAEQLHYLSGSLHSTRQKLRFTLKPLFGFLFFIEGKDSYHYCWELLNSHATYLWSFPKHNSDISFLYQRIEETINRIKDLGRERYKTGYRSKEFDTDLLFKSLEHSTINSSVADNFSYWRNKLEEHLT